MNRCLTCEYYDECDHAEYVNFCEDCNHYDKCTICTVYCEAGLPIECNNGFEVKSNFEE